MSKHTNNLCVIALLSGCVTYVEPTSPQPSVTISNGESWRMTCEGGQGAMRVPIFARVTSYNPSTGRADLMVDDRDGYEGGATAYLSGNSVSLFDAKGDWAENGRSARLTVPDLCPNGLLIARL